MTVQTADAAAPRFDHHFMLGMRLDYISTCRFVEEFTAAARTGVSAYCCVPDVHQCMICHDQPSHRDIVNNADYVVSDSTILQTARALRHGVPAMPTQLGSELMRTLCAQAERQRIPIALIGGRDEEALARLQSRLIEDYPALRIAYGYSPPFRPLTPAEEDRMLLDLATSGARMVFVGIGCPKQEQWMGRYKGRVQGAMIGVGAAFDTIAGVVRSSPAFVHRLGLEWLFRLVREPRRLYRRYFGSAPRFVLLTVADGLRAAFQRG